MSSPLVIVPTGCTAPPPPVAVFVGTLAAADATTGGFAVQRIRAGSLDGYAVNTIVDVRFDDDIRVPVRTRSAVSRRCATGSHHRRAAIQGSSLPAPLFGGDAVIGVNNTDVHCPRFEDGVKTLLVDGSEVDTGVLAPLETAKRSLLKAILKPLGIAIAVLAVLASMKLLVFAMVHALREPDFDLIPAGARGAPGQQARRRCNGRESGFRAGLTRLGDVSGQAWAAVARARRSLTACSSPSGSRYSALPATRTLAPAAAAADDGGRHRSRRRPRYPTSKARPVCRIIDRQPRRSSAPSTRCSSDPQIRGSQSSPTPCPPDPARSATATAGVDGFKTTAALPPSLPISDNARWRWIVDSTCTSSRSHPALQITVDRYRLGGENHEMGFELDRGVLAGRAAITSGPNVRLGTNWPSITSHWMRSTPAASRATISSPRRAKSAGNTEGTISIGRDITSEGSGQ